ncbi:hypothetical protein YC2023_071043 [Brassica napus]
MAATSSSKSVHEITVNELHGHKRMFLLGLQKLGKGDWRGISRNYVNARKLTQISSLRENYLVGNALMSTQSSRDEVHKQKLVKMKEGFDYQKKILLECFLCEIVQKTSPSKEKKTKIALNQVFVPKLALKAKSHKNSTQGVGFRVFNQIVLIFH